MNDPGSVWFILPMAAISFFITGLIGNVLVIRIVHKTRDMHTTTNYLLANLAAGDVATILILFPSFFTFNQPESYAVGKFVCKLLAIGTISLLCSSFTLTVLAVERYHALLKPFRTGLRLKEDNIKQAIAVIWISSIAICSPSFFLNEWSENYSSCVTHKVHVLTIGIVSTYIPMIIFLYCYGSLIKGLYFSHTICAENTDEEGNSEKKKLVITFILATAGFVIGYGPIAISHTIDFSGDDEHIPFKFSKLQGVFYFMFFCSLCLNPILYAFRSTNFREGFKRIIFCRRQPPENDMQMS